MYDQEKTISRIATWGKFTGIVYIILGALSAISGVFAFVVGAIPGVVQVFLGYFLWKIGQEAAKIKANYMDEQAQAFLYDNLGKFLLVQGILMIIGIAFFVIFLAIFGVAFFAMLSEIGNYGY